MKKFFLAAWILMTITFLVLVIAGFFSELSLIVFGFGALALLYSLALWSTYLKRPGLTKTRSNE